MEFEQGLIEGEVTRVIVVGAGVAGLAAARTLHDAGVEVVVLEGRDHAADLAEGLDVRLGWEVAVIETIPEAHGDGVNSETGGMVVVKSRTRQVEWASHALVTLPPGVLQVGPAEGGVEFDPPLPEEPEVVVALGDPVYGHLLFASEPAGGLREARRLLAQRG